MFPGKLKAASAVVNHCSLETRHHKLRSHAGGQPAIHIENVPIHEV